MEIELIQPIAMDEGAALRHPRGRPHGRLGGGDRRSSSSTRARSDLRATLHGGGPQSRLRPSSLSRQESTNGSDSRKTRSGSGSRPTTTRRSRRPPRRSSRRPSAPARRCPGPVPLPTEKNVYCVIRSPFKDKDSREHFEIRTHKRLIDIHQPTPEDGRLAPAARPPAGGRRHRDPAGLRRDGRHSSDGRSA